MNTMNTMNISILNDNFIYIKIILEPPFRVIRTYILSSPDIKKNCGDRVHLLDCDHYYYELFLLNGLQSTVLA